MKKQRPLGVRGKFKLSPKLKAQVQGTTARMGQGLFQGSPPTQMAVDSGLLH